MHTTQESFDLTKRELEVLLRIAEGFTQKEIADQLFVSPNTVNTHAQHILEKLNVHNSPHAVTKAFRAELIS